MVILFPNLRQFILAQLVSLLGNVSAGLGFIGGLIVRLLGGAFFFERAFEFLLLLGQTFGGFLGVGLGLGLRFGISNLIGGFGLFVGDFLRLLAHFL